MKTFFSLTYNVDSPYKKYTIKSLDGEEHDNIINLDEQIDKFERKLSGFTILKFLGIFGMIFSGIFFIGRLIANPYTLFTDRLVKSILNLVGLLVSIAIYVTSLMLFKKTKANIERKELLQKQNDLLNQYYHELGAKDPIVEIDVYMPEVKYNDKDEEEMENTMYHPCLNMPLKVFVDESNNEIGMIYLLSLIRVPKGSITNIEKVNKRIHINAWNKETPFDNKVFKQYSIKTDQFGISVKGYYKVTLLLDGEDYQFFVGGYDFQKFIDLTKFQN